MLNRICCEVKHLYNSALPLSPEPAGVPTTSLAQADRLGNYLKQQHSAWLVVDRYLLTACRQGVEQVAQAGAKVTYIAKGLDPTTTRAGEE